MNMDAEVLTWLVFVDFHHPFSVHWSHTTSLLERLCFTSSHSAHSIAEGHLGGFRIGAGNKSKKYEECSVNILAQLLWWAHVHHSVGCDMGRRSPHHPSTGWGDRCSPPLPTPANFCVFILAPRVAMQYNCSVVLICIYVATDATGQPFIHVVTTWLGYPLFFFNLAIF